jgi:SAM-dependent methyltransferase
MGTSLDAADCAQKVGPDPAHDPSITRYTEDASIAAGYDGHHEYLERFFDHDAAFLKEVLPPASRVIDLGCGTGRHLVQLARLGFDVTGVDLSVHMLGQAAAKLDKLGLEARLVSADICDLGRFASGGFDCAICMFSTLGLIRGARLGARLRRRALAEWRRLLVPGGTLALHVHNVWHNLRDSGGRRWLAGRAFRCLFPGEEFGDSWVPNYYGLPHLFLHLFGWRELTRLLRGAGYRIARTVFLDAPRTGELAGPLKAIRANGFFVAARSLRDPERSYGGGSGSRRSRTESVHGPT